MALSSKLTAELNENMVFQGICFSQTLLNLRCIAGIWGQAVTPLPALKKLCLACNTWKDLASLVAPLSLKQAFARHLTPGGVVKPGFAFMKPV